MSRAVWTDTADYMILRCAACWMPHIVHRQMMRDGISCRDCGAGPLIPEGYGYLQKEKTHEKESYCDINDFLKEDQSMKKMKPIFVKMDGITNYYCPKCKRIIVSTWNLRQSGTKDNYCRECGQGLDWSGITLEVYWVD